MLIRALEAMVVILMFATIPTAILLGSTWIRQRWHRRMQADPGWHPHALATIFTWGLTLAATVALLAIPVGMITMAMVDGADDGQPRHVSGRADGQ
jgi:hypothetical protein